jgi:hypothetical protein
MQLKCIKLHFGCSLALYTCIKAFRKKMLFSFNSLTLKIEIMSRVVELYGANY